MKQRRFWKSHDLCDLFKSTQRGFLPLTIHGNWDTETRDYSIQLEPTWPWSSENEDMKFTIENDVPVKPVGTYSMRSQMSKDLQETMGAIAPGQSFLIPCEDKFARRKAQSLVQNVTRFLGGKLFTTRSVDNGLRVWRLE